MSGLDAWRFQLLGYPLGLGRPLFALALGVALAVAIVALLVALGRRRALRGVVLERLSYKVTPGISVRRPVLRAVLQGLGLCAIALGLTQPQCGSHTELTRRQGIDVVVALDASRSMLARDVQPSRLERARLELLTLLDALAGDRVGIVAFAGEAFIQSPLTTDYAAAKLFLRAIDTEQMQQGGTDIGEALTLAKQVLDNADRGARDRVVVLLSDGEDLKGEVEASVRALAEANIRVYTVGIGSEGGEPIPLVDEGGRMVGYKRDARGATVLTRLDARGLEQIAKATSGEYFHQPRGVAMGQVLDRISKLQKSELESRMTVRYDERFQYFALPGLLLVVAGHLVRPSRRRPA